MSQHNENGILLYNEIRREIGPENARRIFALLKGQQVYFPEYILRKFEHREILREFAAGATYKYLARKYGYTEKYIRYLTAPQRQKVISPGYLF